MSNKTRFVTCKLELEFALALALNRGPFEGRRGRVACVGTPGPHVGSVRSGHV